jgi:hypothetical protein
MVMGPFSWLWTGVESVLYRMMDRRVLVKVNLIVKAMIVSEVCQRWYIIPILYHLYIDFVIIGTGWFTMHHIAVGGNKECESMQKWRYQYADTELGSS